MTPLHFTRTVTTLALMSLLLAAFAGVVACGQRDARRLPPAETFYLPTPADEGGTTLQALCASDTAA
jgi:hypothetical protein